MTATALALLLAGAARAFIADFDAATVESGVSGYATFQSHNQKTVATAHGVFMTYLQEQLDPVTDAARWKLVRSVDGGKTFRLVYSAVSSTRPPGLEADEDGNLYVMAGDWENGVSALFYRFDAAKGFKDPLVRRVPGAYGSKFAMVLDRARRRLYYCAWGRTFFVLGLDGVLKSSYTVTTMGGHAYAHYPHLAMQGGDLYFAWTTTPGAEIRLPGGLVRPDDYIYWTIQVMVSRDGAASWRTLAGAPLSLPVAADETGPTDRITSDAQYGMHRWLSSLSASGGKLHFLYLVQPTTWTAGAYEEHYVRYDAATGVKEIDRTSFAGRTLQLSSLDGFFAQDAPGGRLYAVGKMGYRLAVLVSEDNGATWRDYARGPVEPLGIYAVGGFRRTAGNGGIVGAYTTANPPHDVRFFRVPLDVGLRAVDRSGPFKVAVEPAAAPGSPLRLRGEGGRLHGVKLVEPGAPDASSLRIATPQGVRAVAKL